MNQVFKVYRETVLPSTLQPYALYYIKGQDKDYIEQYATDANANAIRVFDKGEVEKLIQEALVGVGHLTVVTNIDARDAIANATNGTEVFVLDASKDDTVNAGGARYIRNNDAWLKVAETESMDLVLDWTNLQNKPTSTVQAIDDAVAKAHTHTNKSELDKIGEDSNGNLTYGGKSVATEWASATW